MSRILAIDDDVDILFTLQAIGEVGGFEVVTAKNGVEGIKLFQESNYHLIVVDYHMPGMNGLEIVEKLRAIDDHIPILVLTVEESLDLSQKFIEAGATDFAVKPIRPADLISRMKFHIKYVQSQEKEADGLSFDAVNLPKGLTPVTMQMIIDHLQKVNQSKTINQISSEIGLAYQTVHRYLDYLQKMDHVKVEICYGKVGRPIKKYIAK